MVIRKFIFFTSFSMSRLQQDTSSLCDVYLVQQFQVATTKQEAHQSCTEVCAMCIES